MKKLLLTGAILLSTMTTSVNAAERLRVNDIHNFVSNLNQAVNSVSTINGRSALEGMISNQALFEDNTNTHRYGNRVLVNGYYNPTFYNNRVLVNGRYNTSYYGYRYPTHYNAYATNVGYSTNNKWDMISKLEAKKRTIAGYKGTFEVSKTLISPLADSAVVDVNFKEQSLSYLPSLSYSYAPYNSLHSNVNTLSKCKMHLGKMNNVVFLTRMYCNTSTNLAY